MDIKWFQQFFDLYFSGNILEAYKLKYENIPARLYKYQPYDEKRVSAVLQHKMWFALPKNMNDPFECTGICWDSAALEAEKSGAFASKELIVNKYISSLRDDIKISCFSERLYSMPMWAHYADNHKGFCIEYDFKKLNYENDFTKYLFPIGYVNKRYDITDLLKNTSNENIFNLLFFLMNVKHNSWANENEWRIIKIRKSCEKEFCDGLEQCPVKPTAVYLGMNFKEHNILKIKNKFYHEDIPVYMMKSTNSEFFNMKMERI